MFLGGPGPGLPELAAAAAAVPGVGPYHFATAASAFVYLAAVPGGRTGHPTAIPNVYAALQDRSPAPLPLGGLPPAPTSASRLQLVLYDRRGNRLAVLAQLPPPPAVTLDPVIGQYVFQSGRGWWLTLPQREAEVLTGERRLRRRSMRSPRKENEARGTRCSCAAWGLNSC